MKSIEDRPGFLVRHPWLFVVLAFALLLAAWSALITIAVTSFLGLVLTILGPAMVLIAINLST